MTDRILIVTVNKIETTTALEIFSNAINQPWERQTIDKKIYYLFGQINGIEIFMVQSEAGSMLVGGSFSTITKAISSLKPNYIIMVGVAYGLDQRKQKVGDILVSKKIASYEPGKIFTKKFLPRGDRIPSPKYLLDKFRSGDNDWRGASVHFGIVLSGEKLVADEKFRAWLLKLEPESIGGEMEGAGLYVASYEEKVDWILVKGISDWGDENKNDEDQKLAAQNATSFVLHVIKNVGFGIRINKNTNPLQNNTPEASVIEYRRSILDKIQIKFIRQLEEELIENMDKHFSDPKVAQKEQNYLAILYFSQEVDEIYRLSKEIKALYKQFSKSYLTDALMEQLNSKLDSIKQHQELILEIVQAALSAEPNHHLGKSIQRSIDAVSKAITVVRIALLDKSNKTKLNYSILELQQHTEVLLSYMQDMSKYLKQYLPSWSI